MSYQVDNAIIMAAGLSSRFAPLSYERPKALITVKGEVLIERQIRQLKEVGIKEIVVVVGYQKEKFTYLIEKMGVKIIENPYYESRNNNYSLYVAKEYLKNSYICSADNYFTINPFESEVEESYYAAVYVHGKSEEWCMDIDQNDYIKRVTIGSSNSWIMLGHVFFSKVFSKTFLNILTPIIDKEETKGKLWEAIFVENLDQLPMKIKKYKERDIFEFDSLDELRSFDETYFHHSHSKIMEQIAKQLTCDEAEIKAILPIKNNQQQVTGISFTSKDNKYTYDYSSEKVSTYE